MSLSRSTQETLLSSYREHLKESILAIENSAKNELAAPEPTTFTHANNVGSWTLDPVNNVPYMTYQGKSSTWVNYANPDTPETLVAGAALNLPDIGPIKITGGYGARQLEGRGVEHSTAIDYVPMDGKVRALGNGKITKIIRGKDEIIDPSKGASAGNYIEITYDNGVKSSFMHLDPIDENSYKNLLNKRVKRGEAFATIFKGSGSQTGPHVKLRVYGNDMRYNIDPTALLIGKSYNFVPYLNPNGEIVNLFKANNVARKRFGGILYGQ